MGRKQELENEMEALLEKVNEIEQEIRKIELGELSEEDLEEMRQTVYDELEIWAQQNKEDTLFVAYGSHEYRDYINLELKESEKTMDYDTQYQYGVNAAGFIVEWLCWLRVHKLFQDDV